MKKILLVLAAFFIVKANAQQLELVADINTEGSAFSQFDSRPRNFTELFLRRTRETGGKRVDDDETRELMK